MSWWVELKGAGPVPRHEAGGTYALYGSEMADLNITFNYGAALATVLNPEGEPFHLDWLQDKAAKDTSEMLSTLVRTLGTERHSDYWKGTPGNAGYAMSVLLMWASMYPECSWDVC